MNPRFLSILKYTALSLVGLVIVLVAALALMDWDLLKGPVTRIASAKTGRTVSIAGHLRVHLWSTTPTVSIERLQVANPTWEVPRPLLQLSRLEVQLELRSILSGHLVLRRIEIDQPDVYLHQEASGRANWTNENTTPTSSTAQASKPSNLPAIRELIINQGQVALNDEARKLQVKGTIQAHEHSTVQDAQALHVQAQGTINKQPFSMVVSGGALLVVDPDHPYPFKLSIKAAGNEIDAGGQVLKPFDLGRLELQVSAHGPDIAELYYLTQLALPNTPPYQLQGHITRDGQHFTVSALKGVLGRSDIGGSVDVDASHPKPSLTANLSSNHLYMSDLGALTGSRAESGGALDREAVTKPAKTPARAPAPDAGPKMLLPDARLSVSRVRAMNADVRFKATSIEAGKVPFTEVAIHANLQDGVLALDPVQFVMPQGRLSGVINIDARQDIPLVRMDVRATNVDLNQLKGSSPGAVAPVSGVMQARAVVKGRGDSVHALMANANGNFALVIPHGDIRRAFPELLGIDASGVGLLLAKDQTQAPIRCGVARFDLKDGTARAQSVVLDTQNVLITGGGELNLGNEKLDLNIKGQPKKIHLVRIRAPVDIKGQLSKPSILPDKGELLKQGAAAAALGALLTPVAAMLAFVDPGLAKDQDCSQLIAQAHTGGGAIPNASPGS